MSDISDVVGKDQTDREIQNGTLARAALFGSGPKVFDAEKANEEYIPRKKSGMKTITKIVGVVDVILLAGLLYAGATYDGKTEKVPSNMTISHYAIKNDIPTPVLMMRNGLAYPEQLKSGTDFVIYHPGFRGFFENIYDNVSRMKK